MGFDIYGLKPKENGEKPEILNKNFNSLTDKEQDLYVEKHADWEKENPGFYFRSNIWYWRPLWEYVCKVCDEVMTEDDEDAGYTNNGLEISEDTVDNMVSKLLVEMASGKHEEYAKNYALFHNDYPFDVKTLEEFVSFLSESGGIKIC